MSLPYNPTGFGMPAKPKKPTAATSGNDILSFQDFHKKTGKDMSAYTRYAKYVANQRGAKISELKDPFGGVDPFAQFRPTPPQAGQQEARQQGMAAFAPAISGVNQSFDTQNAAYQQAVADYAKKMAMFYRPQVQGALDAGRQTAGALAAEGAALAGAATGRAQEGQAQLSRFMQQINPPTSEFVDNAGARGRSIAAAIANSANRAQNSATIGQGIQGKMLAALPRIQAIAGMQDLTSGLRQFGAKRQDALSGLYSDRAKTIQKLYSDFQNRELTKAAALNTFGLNMQSAPYKNQPSLQTKINDDGSANVVNPKTGAIVKKYPAGTFPRNQPKPPADPNTVKPPTRAETRTARNQAQTAIRTVIKGYTKKIPQYKPGPSLDLGGGLKLPGDPVKVGENTVVTNYPKLLKEAIIAAENILGPYMSHAEIVKFAQQIVNAKFTPGKYGFPLTPEMKAAKQKGTSTAAKGLAEMLLTGQLTRP